MLRLIDKLKRIHHTGVLVVDLTWLNNNYQRSLTHYVRRCSAARLRRLHLPRRHAFNLVVRRFNYFRQFAPALLGHLDFQPEEGVQSRLREAIDLLRDVNETKRRKLPEDPPLSFLPRKIRPKVEVNGSTDRHAKECALLIAIRDEIRAGNIFVAKVNGLGASPTSSFQMSNGMGGVRPSSSVLACLKTRVMFPPI